MARTLSRYRKANQLFARLAAMEDQFKDWVVLGAIDLDQFVEDNLKELVDWEKNFKGQRQRCREVSKVKPLFDKAECKYKLLRSVAGGGVEALTQLQSRWDKFEVMMESHQLMVKEQIKVMKNNVLARVKAFHQEVEKFSARWHQLKPGNDALEGDNETLDKAVAVIKEKRQEFVEIEENMNKIGINNELWMSGECGSAEKK